MTIGIDLGGTRIKGAAINEQGQVLAQLITMTNDGDDQFWKRAIAETVETLFEKTGRAATAVGLSAPGLPNNANTAIAFMPGRLQGLEGFDWADFLKKRVAVLNDSHAAMMAEARFGAAKNLKNALLLTIGTGVGGAILLDGRLFQGRFQKAGHLGHISLDADGSPDIVGTPGSLEDAIGNATIERRSLGRFRSTHQLLGSMREGDVFAKQIWLESVRKLAIGLSSLIHIFSPEAVILGGGISESGEALFEPLHAFLEKYEWRPNGSATPILKAEFGEMAGAIGAASFVF